LGAALSGLGARPLRMGIAAEGLAVIWIRMRSFGC
jgi:hypothetical protein